MMLVFEPEGDFSTSAAIKESSPRERIDAMLAEWIAHNPHLIIGDIVEEFKYLRKPNSAFFEGVK